MKKYTNSYKFVVEQNTKEISGLRSDMANIREDIGKLKGKSSLWGAIAGGVSAVTLILIRFFTTTQ